MTLLLALITQTSAGVPAKPQALTADELMDPKLLAALGSVSVNVGVLNVGVNVLKKRCREITDEFIDNPKVRAYSWLATTCFRGCEVTAA